MQIQNQIRVFKRKIFFLINCLKVIVFNNKDTDDTNRPKHLCLICTWKSRVLISSGSQSANYVLKYVRGDGFE